MRILIVTLLIVLACPAFAAPGWDSYFNGRYGYQIGVPPGFVGQGEPDAHDGQVFHSKDGAQILKVWGGYLADTDFADDVKSRMDDFSKQHWSVNYQATTPKWASYSATKGQRVVYVREILGCKGQQYATFELQYPSVDIGKMNPIVDQLVPSLVQKFCPD
jgi:hypothetical protein